MANDRRVNAYEKATSLDQAMLDETFKGGETEIHTIGVLTKTVGGNTYTLRFSDRAKFVGDNYYQGRAKFPDIKRTVGELVAPELQFSEMEVQLNNVDGFYNHYLSGGADYFSFIGSRLVIQVGIRDVAGTYFTIFDGKVPDEDGFNIDRQSITIRARDKADTLNKATGLPTINDVDYPSAPQESYGKVIPLAIGDWTVGYTVNANSGTLAITISGTQYAIITDSPNNFYGGLIGYPVGGGFFVFSVGSYTPETILSCHVKRGNNLLQVNFTATPYNAAGYWAVQVLSCNLFGGGTVAYVHQDGDVATISVKIPYTVGQYSNPILIAQQLLYTLGDLTSLDLDMTSWNSLSTKSTPPQSAMTAILARIWIGEEQDKILETVLGLLEQVRVELYWNNVGKIALRSIHPEDFSSHGSTRIEQIHIDESSLKVTSDQRNFFNKAIGNFAFTPVIGKTQLQTVTRKNQNSIDKADKEVLKGIDLPALYVESDATLQIDEFIRFYSSSQQYVEANIAWTALLRDLTEVVMINYIVGSIDFNNKPMKIRDITFKPSTACLTFKLLSFANFPYTGYAPANAAQMLSSQTQTIVDA
jgi:hypothetical protein